MADSTIFCWLLQAINDETADAMDHALKHTEGYLGATDVSFGDPVQLHFFRQLLPEFYRFRGSVASILYTGGSNPDPDIAEKEIIEDSGMSVRYEDIGARKTMFDQYTDLEYFQRIEYVLDVASGLEGISGETVSELALTLEEIHPHLFNILAAAMRAIHTSQTEEDLAQAALSGRRFLEALANYWFPAREGLINGRKVGLQQYRNRIWAYLTDAANSADPPAIDRVPALGARLEELVEDFNAGLHAKVERQRMERSFIGLLIWLDAVIRLNPDAAVRPYLAYEFQIMAYWEKLAKRNFG
ncbi:hypothetical protein [Phytohabitans aurantiacus]|nr:hypothetical protein [Phytohabitans aurantiacus]